MSGRRTTWRFFCDCADDTDDSGYNIHFYRVFLVIVVILVTNLYVQPLKNTYQQNVFVPLKTLSQTLLLNLLTIAFLFSKGKKMRGHIISYFNKEKPYHVII